MNAKRVLPLALLYEADDYRIEGRTKFQKLAFLAEERLKDEGIEPYDFVPYDYGPFAEDLLHEIEALEEEGLVEVNKDRTLGGNERYDYELTENGRDTFEANPPEDADEEAIGRFNTIREIAKEIIDEYGDYPVMNLLDYVYDEYEEYATKSVL